MATKRKGRPMQIAVRLEQSELADVVAGRDELVDIKQLKQRLKVRSNTTIYDWCRQGHLPKPRQIGRNRARWLLSEIAAA